MFAITPRITDNIFQLAEELANPWFTRSPALLRDSALAELEGRLGDSEVHNTDKELRIRLDLQHYKPEEVKITSDSKKIKIHAKHEEKQDKHGFVSREMIRTYTLPDYHIPCITHAAQYCDGRNHPYQHPYMDVDAKSVTSTMNTNGTLNIRIAKKALEAPKEIPIAVEYKK